MATVTINVKREPDNVSLTSTEGGDRAWREQALQIADQTGNKYQSIYQQLGLNSSSDSIDRISYAQTPDRVPQTVVETNPNRGRRQIWVKHRPLRKWMEKKGPTGLVTRVLSNIQTAGHWGLAIGPYTYDIYQIEGAVIFHVGQWKVDKPGENDRVKKNEVGHSSMTDLEILKLARTTYERMKPQGYDEKFNNCHKFVIGLAENIADDSTMISVRLRFQYMWNLLPASYLFHAGQYASLFPRISKTTLLSNMLDDLLDAESRADLWRVVKVNSIIASKMIMLLLTAGPMMVFLATARGLTRWNPDNPQHKAQYLELFEKYGIPNEWANFYFQCAFEGPKGLEDIVKTLLRTLTSESGSHGLRGALKRIADVAR